MPSPLVVGKSPSPNSVLVRFEVKLAVYPTLTPSTNVAKLPDAFLVIAMCCHCPALIVPAAPPA